MDMEIWKEQVYGVGIDMIFKKFKFYLRIN